MRNNASVLIEFLFNSIATSIELCCVTERPSFFTPRPVAHSSEVAGFSAARKKDTEKGKVQQWSYSSVAVSGYRGEIKVTRATSYTCS